MICVGEAMRLVANALEQSQGARVEWKLQRQAPSRPVNLFSFLGQADNGKIMQAQSLQFTAGGRELAFSAIDNNQIGQANGNKTRVIPSGFEEFRCNTRRFRLEVAGLRFAAL